MTDRTEDIRERIQSSIDNARRNVSTRIEEIDQQLRESLDLKQKASDYAPEICIGGLVTGVFLGLASNRRLLTTIAIGLPLAIVARFASEMMENDESTDELSDSEDEATATS